MPVREKDESARGEEIYCAPLTSLVVAPIKVSMPSPDINRVHTLLDDPEMVLEPRGMEQSTQTDNSTDRIAGMDKTSNGGSCEMAAVTSRARSIGGCMTVVTTPNSLALALAPPTRMPPELCSMCSHSFSSMMVSWRR